jgi:uncharacterized protein YifN (PemK superfamily)
MRIAMIRFTPRRGQILMCDFDMATVAPEMRKKRRVVILSPRSLNGPHGAKPGKCIVVPLSATTPRRVLGSHVAFPVGSYDSLSVDVWAICEAIAHVSHIRLDRVPVGSEHLSEMMDASDVCRIEEGVRFALGMTT